MRSLKQNWDCAAAKALNTDTCKLLCTCVAGKNAAEGKMCPDACTACAKAAAGCAAGSGLPKACATYSKNPDVIACISGAGAAGRRMF
jgi:hypothetical protein